MAKNTSNTNVETITSPERISETIQQTLTVGQGKEIMQNQQQPVVKLTETKKEYDIISFSDPNKLKAAVNIAINSGWEFVGGLNVALGMSPNGVSIIYSQAVFRQ